MAMNPDKELLNLDKESGHGMVVGMDFSLIYSRLSIVILLLLII